MLERGIYPSFSEMGQMILKDIDVEAFEDENFFEKNYVNYANKSASFSPTPQSSLSPPPLSSSSSSSFSSLSSYRQRNLIDQPYLSADRPLVLNNAHDVVEHINPFLNFQYDENDEIDFLYHNKFMHSTNPFLNNYNIRSLNESKDYNYLKFLSRD